MLEGSERLLLRNALKQLSEDNNIDVKSLEEWFYSTEAVTNYSVVFPFEMKNNRAYFFITAHDNWLLSLIISMIYIVAVFGGQKFMSQRKPFELRGPLIAWNLFMAIFSAVGFARTSHELYRVLWLHGFQYSVCISTYGRDPVAAFWIMTFIRSKVIELIDTAFIVLRKRPLIFLHYYHHLTVLVFAWHTAKNGTAAGRWYAWMNYGVHMFMYSYYSATAMKFRPPRWIQIYITTLQLSQMIMGIVISYAVFVAKLDPTVRCFQTWENLGFAIAIYASYFLLFAKYFYDAYLSPKKAKLEVAISDKMIRDKND